MLVARSDGSLRVHDARTGEETAVFENLPKPARQLAFSADGQRLAAACDGGVIRVFGKAGKTWVSLLDVPGDGTAGVSFNATGRALAAAGARETVVFGSFAD